MALYNTSDVSPPLQIVGFPESYGDFRPQIHEFLSSTPGNYVIDIGCGNGDSSFFAGSIGKHVVGVDISSANLKQAWVNVETSIKEQLDLVICDSEHLPFKKKLLMLPCVYSCCTTLQVLRH